MKLNTSFISGSIFLWNKLRFVCLVLLWLKHGRLRPGWQPLIYRQRQKFLLSVFFFFPLMKPEPFYQARVVHIIMYRGSRLYVIFFPSHLWPRFFLYWEWPSIWSRCFAFQRMTSVSVAVQQSVLRTCEMQKWSEAR